MRLLNSRSIELELLHTHPARYAIVSHRWGDESEEVLFTDIGEPARAQSKGKGYDKIQGSCTQAMQDGINYVWLDTCCIDKSNSTELMEAINLMYKWYHKSTVCYAYLQDVSDPAEFIKSEWFSRGWTLQELVAPKVLKFFTKDWGFIGTREDLMDPIAERTGISPDILRSGKIPREVTISQKMVWASKRETTKMEDRSYSLLGILGIRMVPLYGVDDGAFEDLQHRLIVKSPDQTLFAWYHTFIQPEDVEMTDADPAPGPTPTPSLNPLPASAPNPTSDAAAKPTSDSASNPTPESIEADANTPPLNITGLLASSPSHYLKCYEIPERDFCKNYVDNIRDYGYRSQFSISNNLVRITLPMKHVIGRVWKAVLRCSFDPPGGDQVQRPLVIYLKEIQPPWKFARVHLAPEEEMGDDQTNEIRGVSGSLERLEDSEVNLHGYLLRDIDVVGRDGESTSDDQLKQPPSDPNSLPEPTEAERIAQLPRHPLGVKTTNIMVCGEPGVATGRVINFIIGSTVLKPLTDYEREPMAVTVIDTTIRSKSIRILYVIGPRDPYLELPTYHTTIRNMYQFVQLVKEAGGIHLLLMCMVGSRVTAALQNNYRLFYDYICRREVPMILVITGLGKTRRLEDWWETHANDPELQPMTGCIRGHACVTVLQGDDDEQGKKYQESMQTVQRLVREFMESLETTAKEYLPGDVKQWFVSMGKGAMDFLLFGKKSLRQEAVKKTLKEGINLSEIEATNLVRQFFDEHLMEL